MRVKMLIIEMKKDLEYDNFAERFNRNEENEFTTHFNDFETNDAQKLSLLYKKYNLIFCYKNTYHYFQSGF